MIGPEAWKLLDQSTQYSVRLMLADLKLDELSN